MIGYYIGNVIEYIVKSGYCFARTLYKHNKEKRYSRVPRLSDTRYSAKGTKGKWIYASSKARLKRHLPAISIYRYVDGRQI